MQTSGRRWETYPSDKNATSNSSALLLFWRRAKSVIAQVDTTNFKHQFRAFFGRTFGNSSQLKKRIVNAPMLTSLSERIRWYASIVGPRVINRLHAGAVVFSSMGVDLKHHMSVPNRKLRNKFNATLRHFKQARHGYQRHFRLSSMLSTVHEKRQLIIWSCPSCH